MKRYERYKDSEVEWIGEIPDSWKVRPIKRLCSVKRGASPRPIDDEKYFDDNGEYSWVRIADVTASDKYLRNTSQKLSELGASLSVKMEPDNIFLSIAGSVGKPIINKIKCCIHDGFVWFDGLKLNSEFLYYIFLCGEPYKGLGKYGTQLNLNTETVGSIKIPLPAENEIIKVVEYLNKKYSEIDHIIKQKESLLEKLQAKRQAIINEAVTKGLNPNVPTKASGIMWLGDIPKHWEIKKLKYLITKVGSGVTPKGGAEVYVDSGIPLFRSQNIYNDGLRLNDVAYITKATHEEMSGSRVFNGDVLLNITGASIGRCYYYDGSLGEVNVNQHVCIIRPIQDSIRTEYLHRVLCSVIGQEQINILQTGANREGLNGIQLKSFVIPLPSIEEQEKILKQTDKKLKEIQKVESLLDVQIEKLKVYRQSLISEVVTGKIKVV